MDTTGTAPRTTPGRLRWLLWALPPAIFAGGWGAHLAQGLADGRVRWKAWEHPLPAPWTWSGFIHPPLFGEHQRLVERWSTSHDLPSDQTLAWIAAALAPLVVLLAAGVAHRAGRSSAWAGYAALLMALSPTGLRPFEQYHAARLILAAALAAVLGYALRGGRWRAAGAFLACLLATQFHLSSWFVLGPLLVLLLHPHPERRRGLAAICVALLVSFWLLAQPGGLYANALVDVFDQPDVRSGNIFSRASFLNPTFELSNRWLFLPLLLCLLPPAWRAERRGVALAASTGIFVAVHVLLQRRGYALHAQAPTPHHYFELIEIAAVVGVTWLLSDGWNRWPGRWFRAVVVAAAALVLATQVGGWLHVNELITR